MPFLMESIVFQRYLHIQSTHTHITHAVRFLRFTFTVRIFCTIFFLLLVVCRVCATKSIKYALRAGKTARKIKITNEPTKVNNIVMASKKAFGTFVLYGAYEWHRYATRSHRTARITRS